MLNREKEKAVLEMEETSPVEKKSFLSDIINDEYKKQSRRLWREFSYRIIVWSVTLIVSFLVCLAVNLLGYKMGFEVLIDGEVIGNVIQQKPVYDALASAKENIENFSYQTFNKEATFIRRIVKEKETLSARDIENILYENIDLMVEGYGIYVKDELICGVTSKDVADWVLSEYKERYRGKNVSDGARVEFVERVEVHKGYINIAHFKLPEDAIKLFTGSGRQVKQYKIKRNDTLWDIANAYGMSVEKLMAANPGLTENIREGQSINVEEITPILNVKSIADERYFVEIPFPVERQEDDTIYKGTTKVVSRGVKGKERVAAKVVRVNGVEQSREIFERETISEPVAQIEKVGTKKRPPTTGSGTFQRPASGVLTSRYGRRWGRNHNGIDIGGSYGSAILAADGGVVTYAGWMSGYGNYVIINHENGYQTCYGHNASLLVRVGSRVRKGQQIAKMGSTGRSTGVHLHFEIKKNGVYQNPLNYVSY